MKRASLPLLRRRELITLLGGASAAWPMGARAQQRQRKIRVGILMNLAAGHIEGQRRLTAFTQTMAQLGWLDGNNVIFDVRWTDGIADAARTNALSVVAASPDVIFASGGNAARAARSATSTTSIIFNQVTDPVGIGLVASLSAPGGNATGFTPWEFGFSGKWFELLRELLPNLSRVAVIRSTTNPAPISQFAVIQSLAQSFGIEVVPASPSSDDEVRNVLSAVAGRPGGGVIVVTGLSELNQYQATLLSLAAEHRLPAVYPYRFMAEAGGLASYGTDTREPYRKAAEYVDRVLKGEKPANLPVQAAAKFELVINLKTARALGITVPPTLLARADEVIE